MSYGFGSDEEGDGEFEEFRENVDHAMWEILTGYGRDRLPVFALGTVASIVSRALELVPAVVLGLASYGFVRLIQPKYYRVRSSVGALNARLENNVSGIEAVKSYTNETYEHERVEEASREYLEANWEAITTRIKFWPTLQLLTGVGYLLTFVLGGY